MFWKCACKKSYSFTLRTSLSLNTGRPLAKMKELERNTQNFAIRTPRFAREFSICNPPSHAEGGYPQNCMIEQSRNQFPEMHFDKFPDPLTFQYWKTIFKTEVCSCSGFPTEAMFWVGEVEMVEPVDDLKSSRSTREHHFQNFEMLDAKIAFALKKKIIQNSYSYFALLYDDVQYFDTRWDAFLLSIIRRCS